MKISIITYHSAYNFGSALQAFAMQTAVEKFAEDVKIINYRMEEQAEFYQHLYRTKYGIKTFIKDLTLFPLQKQRKLRAERFERFFKDNFKLTSEVSDPALAIKQLSSFDKAISGSDQIWNKHSCELRDNDWRYMDPYLLKGFEGIKISYASSVGNMTDKELQKIIPYLNKFNSLSFRESVSKKRMDKLLNVKSRTVLDPTFLLTRDEWIKAFKLKKNTAQKYILFYFLGGLVDFKNIMPEIKKISLKTNRKVKIIAPFVYLPVSNKWAEYDMEFGPIEFLEALYNADTVITSSYHGTILSVNFGKDVYSLCKKGGAEFRKTDILLRLGLGDRVINNIDDILNKSFEPINYDDVYKKLESLRQESYDYLKTAVCSEK